MSEFAIGSRLPKSVLVAPDELYQKIASGPDTVDLLESVDAVVVPYSVSPQFQESNVLAVRHHLEAQGQLTKGALLIKNPYDPETFELSENAIEAFTEAKYRATAKVALLLGATEVTCTETRIESETAAWNADLKAALKIGDGSANAKREVKKRVNARLHMHYVSAGGDPSPAEALEYLERRNLANDYRLRDLIELRSGTNKVLEVELVVSGTRESDSYLACGLELANAGPVKLLQIGAAFTMTMQAVKNVDITVKMVFSPH